MTDRKRLPLVTLPSASLRNPSTRVTQEQWSEITALIPLMRATMHAENGLGLAAPQIGQNIRLCVIELDGVFSVFINPTITAASRELTIYEEGCLSIPGKFLPIVRSQSVQVRFTTPDGTQKKLRAHGLLAIALQHELDHLDGVLIVDRHTTQTAQRRHLTASTLRYHG